MISPRTCLSLLCVVLLGVLGVLGCGSPLVGLECRAGYTRCGDACYDLARDPAHCGSCEVACGAAQSCVASACVAAPEGDGGSPGDGGTDDGGPAADGGTPSDGGPDIDASLDGGDLDGGDLDGAAPGDGGTQPDASVPVSVPCTGVGSPPDCACALGQLKCPLTLTCVDARTDPANCGACGNMCLPSEVCAAGDCAPRCGTLSLCGEICVDTAEDLAHCGGCGQACTAGAACIGGTCVGRAVGHVVMIGHDMTAARPPMRTMVGNALFLVRSAPVRVLVYEAQTAEGSKTGIADAMRLSAQSLGRTYTVTPAAAEQLTLQLSAADVLVVGPQQAASDADLQMLGTVWSTALRGFLRRGGVILLFDAGGANAGTYQILGPDGADLMPVTGRSAAFASRDLELVAFSDAIAAGMPSRYRSEGLTATFVVDPAVPVVVRDPISMLPVVIHLAATIP